MSFFGVFEKNYFKDQFLHVPYDIYFPSSLLH